MIVDLYGARIERAVKAAVRDVRNLVDKYDDVKTALLAVMEVVQTKELNKLNEDDAVLYLNLVASIEVEE